MSKAVALTEIKGKLETMRPQFAMRLPSHIKVERFQSAAITAVQNDPQLLAADAHSLFMACLKAAQDGLMPDGREAALVIFNKKVSKKDEQDKWEKHVQYMPMYAGILKRIRNSGELASIAAHVVYEKDNFAYELGDDEFIRHTPFMDGERGKPRLVYAIAKMKDGAVYREVMTVNEIEQVRAVSKAKNSGPWVDWWGEMAKKTVVRRLSKRLPLSTEVDDFIRQDDSLIDLDAPAATTMPAQPVQQIENLNAKIKSKAAKKTSPPQSKETEPTSEPVETETEQTEDEDFLGDDGE